MEQPRLDITDRLRTALESGDMTPEQERRGENLLSRLKSPVRIAILGPRRSGKSSVLNVLAGAAVLPEGKPLPTLQLTWGEALETTCIYGDGTRRQFGDPKPQDLVANSPIFIEMRRRLPALRTVALLEVVMDGTFAQKQRALAWAAQRCDLALWCTATFDDEEQDLWRAMPTTLQDHATLVLTRADKFLSTEAIADRLAELGGAAAGRFRDIRPLASLQALSAFHPDGSAETAILQRSGGQALIGSLLTEVEKGRRAIRNAAEALLVEMSRTEMVVDMPDGVVLPSTEAPEDEVDPEEVVQTVQAAVAAAPKPAANVVQFDRAPKSATPATEGPVDTIPKEAEAIPEAATPAKPAPEPVAKQATTPAPVAEEASEPTPAAEPEPAPVVEPDVTPEPRIEISEEGREALESVVGYLSGRAIEMLEMLDQGADDLDTVATDEVIPALLDDANWLTEFLAAPFHEDDDLVEPTRGAAYDIADLIQLMEMERDPGAAVDAACLMLQAKRDIQALLAA